MIGSVLRDSSRKIIPPLRGNHTPQSGCDGGHSRKLVPGPERGAGIRHFLSILLLLPLLTGFIPEATAQTPTLSALSIAGNGDITEGGMASFTITATPTPTSNLSVVVGFTEPSGNTLSPGTLLQTVTIGTGGSATFTVSTVNDSVQEISGTIRATISDSENYTITTRRAEVTVHDNDTIISVALPSVEGVTRKNGAQVHDEITGAVTFNITAGPAAAPQALTVCLNVAETGGNRVASGNEGATTVTIPSGSLTTTHTVNWSNTSADDRDSTITITALSPSATCSQTGYQAHASDFRDQALVVDDEATEVSLARDGTGSVIEGTPIDFTVTLGRALFTGEIIEILLPISGTNVTPADWSLTLEPGTSNPGVNLGATTTATPRVSFSGAGAQTAHLRLTPAIDNTDEGVSETYTITLGNDHTTTNVGGGSTPSSTANTFNVVVTDQTLPVISIRHTNYNRNTLVNPPQTESATGSFTLTATPPFNVSRSVSLMITDAPNADYVPAGNQGARTVQFGSSGAGAMTQTYSFPILTDDTDEPNGRVTATLVAGTGYTIDADESSHFFDARDNDPTTVTLARSGTANAIGENGGVATLTVTLGRRLRAGETVTAPLTVTGTGISASDYTLALASGSNLNSGVTLNTASPHSAATPAVVFSGHDTNTVQTATLTLTAVEDTNDEGTSETLTVDFGSSSRAVMSNLDRSSGTGASGTTPTGTVAVVITDNDAPAVVPVASFATATESYTEKVGTASARTQNVRVNFSAPTGGITLNYTVTGTATSGADYTALTGTVAVSASATHVDIPIVVTDDTTDEAGETVILTLNNGTGYTVNASSNTHTLTLVDNDATTVTIAAGSDTLATEGDSNDTAQITLTLSRELYAGESLSTPISTNISSLGALTLALSGTPAGVTFNSNGSVVTFTGSDTGSATVATLNVTALDDEDADDETFTFRILVASGGLDGGITHSGTASITVDDDDTRGLTLTSLTPTLVEGGSSTYTVKLDTKPSASVTVTITGHASTDLTVDTDSGTQGNQNTLTFNPTGANLWSTAQTVTITAAADVDTANDTVMLTHTASGGDYGSVEEDLDVTITDNDTAGLVLPATLTVNEGQDGNYTVALAQLPTGAVTVTVTVPSNTDVTIDGPDAGATFSASEVLNFTTSNWNQTQTVTVRAGQDDDPTDDTVTLTHTAAGGGYDSVTDDVAVTITDDDEAGLTFSRTSLTVAEGSSNTYTVVLDTRPAAAVTVTIQGHASTDLTLNPTSLTFNPSGANLWSTAQTVTVVAAQDDDTANDAATLAHTAAGGDYESITGNVAVTVTDDDTPTPVNPPQPTNPPQPVTPTNSVTPTTPTTPTTPGEPTDPQQPDEPDEPQPVIPVLTIQADTDSVTEGAPASFTVTADPAPVEPLSVSLTIAGQGDFTTPESTGTKNRIIDRATTSLMTPTVNDFIDEENGSITLTLQAADGYTLATDSATIAIHDDDTAGMELSTQGIRITQIGETGQYTVQLTSQPTSPVTITLIQPDTAIVTFSPSSLIFTPDNWNLPQPFTLTAQQEGSVTLVHAITSQDSNYQGMESTAGRLRILVGEDLTAVALPWQTRFVRTQAGQVLDRISDRIQSTSTPGLSAQLAGYRMNPTPQDMQSRWTQNPVPEAHSRTVTMSELLSDSSMSWTTATHGSIHSFWAQGALSEFDAKSGETTLNGEVLTTLIGVDQSHASGQRGLILSYSQGEGEYHTKNKGEIESTHTLFTPWQSKEVNDRMTIWGALGYGAGDLTLIRSGREDLTTDTNTAFLAIGSEAILQEEANRTWSVVTDALWLRTRTDAVADGLELNDASAHVSRMRAGLEGRWRKTLERFPRFRGQALDLRLESALRHDGGDAESGFGMEVGGGIQWTHPRHGLDLAINGRTLITHHDSDLKDRGLSVSMGFDPSPANQGFTFTLKQDWGTTSSGMERLLDAEPIQKTESDTSGRLTAQAGYRFTVREGRYTARPVLGVGLSGEDRETSLGWRLESITGRSNRTLGLKLTRQENTGKPSEHYIKMEAGVRW